VFRRATRPGLAVGRPPEAVLAEITGYMARGGFVVTQSGPASVTFTRRKRPDWQLIVLIVGVAVLSVSALEQSPILLLLWWCLLAMVLVIYLLYHAAVRPRVTTGVTVLGSNEGTEVVLSGDDKRGKRDVERWVQDNAAPLQ